MRELLMSIAGRSIFETRVWVEGNKGTVALFGVNFPQSGIPARELQVFINVPEFKTMKVTGAGIEFKYEIKDCGPASQRKFMGS